MIHTYTRAQAVADGVLVDATAAAREAGFTWPLALTAAAWAEAVAWEETNAAVQDVEGRLWDVLTMAGCAARRGGGADRVAFRVLRVPNTPRALQPKYLTLQLLLGAGDNGEPVLTVALPGED